jgi:hypothetical protein
MENLDPVETVRYVAEKKWSEIGGYRLCVITEDGQIFCSSCVKDEIDHFLDSTGHQINDGRNVVRMITEAELEPTECYICGESLGG